MKNQYSEKLANAAINRFRKTKTSKDLAVCVYASQLLGREPSLVLHGGGNTSVKISDKSVGDILYVKGSGSDLAVIEPAGFPALDLEDLADLQSLSELADEDMMKLLRAAKLDPDAPNPSVETLLHAFLPDKFVSHTHSNAVLALTNQADGAKRCAKAFGDRVAVLPYAMSGFTLAKKAAAARQKNPDIEGLVFMKHGLFTFGETAKEAYGRMIGLVSVAEAVLKQKPKKTFVAAKLPSKLGPLAEVAPIIRGALGPGWLLDFRTSPAIKYFVNGKELSRYGAAGPVTPDHVIWTKPKPLILAAPDAAAMEDYGAGVDRAVDTFETRYLSSYVKHNARHGGEKIVRDATPRVILVPGLGLFGVGRSMKDAGIAADLAEVNIAVITGAEAIGRYRPASAADIFDIEYWSPEAAKLGASKLLPLQGQVALVTGGGSGIGAATAAAFADQGAAVVVLDLNARAAEDVAAEINGIGIVCDVTNPRDVRRAFDAACKSFGGVDIVVSNAGAAWQGEIGTVDEAVIRKSFELNFFAHQTIAQNAVRVMRAQGVGGRLLFNTSKQAVNPGADFGPYGLPKAATLFLMRQYAVDHGKDGITSNAVNADRIRSGLLTGDMIASRSKARSLSEEDYMSGNLLGEEVFAEDVAKAFVDLALSPKTTAAVITVDGGNIAAALR
ncbi:MAG: bifunctional aldolase/short-chain dehydrogenase [Rhodospirillales bacterium]|jgi:rhamnose utilization protein RhaD (predicted bifunctional aldolase and dehydrogenase)/NAD(P)-dependent dehydrogenase (short-subunit alcohol dehydrogenase family)